jgi:hypothetical protein
VEDQAQQKLNTEMNRPTPRPAEPATWKPGTSQATSSRSSALMTIRTSPRRQRDRRRQENQERLEDRMGEPNSSPEHQGLDESNRTLLLNRSLPPTATARSRPEHDEAQQLDAHGQAV